MARAQVRRLSICDAGVVRRGPHRGRTVVEISNPPDDVRVGGVVWWHEPSLRLKVLTVADRREYPPSRPNAVPVVVEVLL